MTAVTGAGQAGFGLGPGRAPNPASATASAHPRLRFTALDGLRGLAVPFVLAFALRSDIARLHAPVDVQYLADGGYVLVSLFFVLAGFLLCRPLSAVLAGSTAEAAALGLGLARRIAPLHLAAWAITFGWLVTEASPGSAGTVWSWLSSGLLLNGVAGPERTGYPVSWSVSVALCCVALLMVIVLALASLSGRNRRTSQDFARPGSIRTPFDGGPLMTGMAVTAGLIGAGLLLFTAPEAAGTTGPVAIGQALLGFGFGLLTFRLLEGATGTLRAPLPRTAPAPYPAPGLGALLALAALLFCVYRSDLMYELKLLPVFPIAAALVYCLAMPHASGRSPVNRILDARVLQWLGTRALGVYVLHGPVQLTVERVCELRGLDRGSTPVAYGVLATVVLGSLITAELGYRLLEHRLAATVPTVATSMYRRPHSRPDRISRIDQNAIPDELRLKPRPRTIEQPVVPVVPAAVEPAATSVELPAQSIELPADKPIDLDRPTGKPGSEDKILDADAKNLDADAQP